MNLLQRAVFLLAVVVFALFALYNYNMDDEKVDSHSFSI